MRYYADLHVHSKHAYACSRLADLEHLAYHAAQKGLHVVATGDFTHPVWLAELKEKLVPAEPGLWRLKPEIEKAVQALLPPSLQQLPRFILSVEVSTIYGAAGKTRKIHHLIYVPDFAAADRLVAALSKIGNLKADGRPTLGMDARDLLEIVLGTGPDSYLIPAHIWTPWFGIVGSKAGFDGIDDCYRDLAPHIFAAETGLSSDPEMNWRVSSLDRFRLISCSDAHSPQKLGREATAFEGELSYYRLKRALETGEGYVGTVEFFPEEGKYHLDGHRECGVRLTPEETAKLNGLCPVCGKRVTVGVMHRVEALADRPERTNEVPGTAGETTSLVPLVEILSEVEGTGVGSQKVSKKYTALTSALGPELEVLSVVPLEDIRRESGDVLAEGIRRLRAREVIREAGYDGEYGVIRLFHDEELAPKTREKAKRLEEVSS